MFEAILPYRREASVLLSQQIAAGTFPHATLFAGPRFSGRMTLAMESARVLSCKEGGAARCTCASCTSFSDYGMQNVVAVGNRDHWTRIEAALSIFSQLCTDQSRRRLLWAIRIMLLQYHGALLDSTEAKGSGAFNAASDLDEGLLSLEDFSSEDCAAYAKKVREMLKPMQTAQKRNGALSIAQVRALQEWTVQTSFGNRPRFIILEGIEYSTEGARNSLLKLLEEPPAHTYIMLLSENPGRLLATILSRVQRHQVAPYSEEEKNRLLADLYFTDGAHYRSIEQFMLMQAGIPCDELDQLARRFAEAGVHGEPLERQELDRMFAELDEPVRLEYFLQEFQAFVRKLFLSGSVTEKVASRLVRIAGEAALQGSVFNQNGKLMVESLHYRLMEVS